MTSHLSEWLLDPLPPGTEVDSWRVQSHRGGGSYGIVYRAERIGSVQEGPFALKVSTTSMDGRFEREAALLSRIHHPNVPRLLDYGVWTHPSSVALPYLAMEWVEGVSLYDWAAQHPRTSRQVLRVLAQLARALEATHRAGCVHRDVKGDNVLVSPEGRAFLMDFGAGKFRGARPLTYGLLPPGTAQYRSPQALRFQWVYRLHSGISYEHTEADDVYALGVAAYYAVIGSYPPAGFDLARAVEPTREPQPSLQPPKKLATVCSELNALILRMLSDAPEARGHAGEVALALEQAADSAGSRADAPITLRPQRAASRWKAWPRAALAALGLAVAVGGVVLTLSPAVRLRAADKSEGGTVALGDTVPRVFQSVATQPASSKGLALEMPKRPITGQRLPPCNRDVEVEIELTPGKKDTRSCWVRIYASTENCKTTAYEYKGGCYLPIFPAPKVPQSFGP